MSFEALAAALNGAIQSAAFSARNLDHATLEQYLEWIGEDASAGSPSLIESVSAELGEDSLIELLSILRPLVDQYVIDDQIGIGFIHDGYWPTIVSLPKFAAMSTVAAARLGPDDAARQIFQWASGDSVRVRNCAIIRGIWISKSMTLGAGRRLQPLQDPIAMSSHVVPERILRFLGALQLDGAVKLAVDCNADSPLFKPGSEYVIPDDTDQLSDVADAIALTLNHQVRPLCSWLEWPDARGFPESETLRNHFPPVWPNIRLRLRPDHRPRVVDVLQKIRTDSQGQRELRTAIFRWIESRSPGSLVDQFIELRIALESLYLQQGSQGESRFKVANHGAWYLGGDFEQRVKYQRRLSRAYDRASTAIHSGRIDESRDNYAVLNRGQDLVRLGILKRLDQGGSAPKWRDVILGNADSIHSSN